MTVQELIDELSKIEDKNREIKLQEVGYGNPLLDFDYEADVNNEGSYIILRGY